MPDDWNHRSQFAGPSDPGLKTVTANTNERRAGPTMSRQETEAFLADGKTDRERREAAKRRRQERRNAEHETVERISGMSNREKLLAGETVSVTTR